MIKLRSRLVQAGCTARYSVVTVNVHRPGCREFWNPKASFDSLPVALEFSRRVELIATSERRVYIYDRHTRGLLSPRIRKVEAGTVVVDAVHGRHW